MTTERVWGMVRTIRNGVGVLFINGNGVWAFWVRESQPAGDFIRVRMSIDDLDALGIHEYQRVQLKLPRHDDQVLYFRSRKVRRHACIFYQNAPYPPLAEACHRTATWITVPIRRHLDGSSHRVDSRSDGGVRCFPGMSLSALEARFRQIRGRQFGCFSWKTLAAASLRG
jgi:hypothetical protein